MTDGITSLFFAVGVGAWIYAKLSRSTGGNAKNSLAAALLAGGGAFLFLFTLLKMLGI